jgi:hypothetical protein
MLTAECRVATERFMAYLEHPDLHRAEADAAMEHIRACLYCERRLGYFIRALAMAEEDELTCQACQDALPDFVQAGQEGQAGEAHWRRVARHLETCPHCSAEYVLLMDGIELAFGEQGVEPPRFPRPDLSFLRAERQTARRAWRMDELGRLIIEFSAGLLRALQPPAAQPAFAVVKSDRSSKVLCQFSLKEQVKDLDVTITAEELRDDPHHCTVIVEAEVPSRGGWPNLGGTQVILKRGEREEIRRTDAFGAAVFEGVATDDLAQLVVEITPHP